MADPPHTDVLFAPGRIGSVEIPNRIVMPPMTTRAADAEGFVTEDSIAYYRARARGGVGLIIVEMASPEMCGRHRHHELGIYKDEFISGLTRLVETIHAAGSKASIQLGHGGGHTRIDICGEQPIAPSAIPHPVYEITFETIVPEEMSQARIRQTIAAYAAAAARARHAGFDCVEIHAAHGYLISQFLTPFENRRTDEYGGSLRNRARFGFEILDAVKRSVPGMPVIFRLSVDDYFPEGMTYEEGRQVALWAAEAGADALHITAGHYRSLPSAARQIPPMALPDATFLGYAADIKKNVKIPVIAVGRLGDPATARDAIASGKADFIALGRTLIADPQWPEKVRRGETPRRCLACNTCVNEMRGGAKLGCIVNGMAGKERRFEGAEPPRGERIAVIGAGPAGLTYASLVADENTVTIFERDATAGGAFRYTGKVPLFQEVEADEESFRLYIEGMVQACERRGVTFRYHFDVRAAPSPLAGFDRIVIATGARYRFGIGGLLMTLIDAGAARWPAIRDIASSSKFRNWFYYKLRRATGGDVRSLLSPDQKLCVIGDAARPGKSKEATSSAFEAALLHASEPRPTAAP
ncbi:MAG TPA: NAD(P)-binding protein [Pseudolabrys sp.]|jgi:dimethylglycine catabolism A